MSVRAVKQAFFIVALMTIAVGRASAQSLPDFTGLVERSAPAVVKVSTRRAAAGGESAQSAEVPEIFRRFFGPNAPVPQPRGPSTGVGSGFIISPDGYVLTNNHVVEGAEEITVRLRDRRELKARVVGRDPQTDVALLKVEGGNLPALPLGDSKLLKPGQWVVAIGSPFGLDYTVTAGIVSAVGRSADARQRYVPFIQTDVAVNQGNSGGPLLNTRGEVVGINSQIFSNTGGYMGVSFAIPIETARRVADQLREGGRVRRGSIGVNIQDVDGALAEALRLPTASGALVQRVVPGSAAAKAGVREGDVIVEFNGEPVVDWQQLPPMVGAQQPGTRAEIVVVREGGNVRLPITVDELQEEATASATSGSVPESGNNTGSVASELGLTVTDPDADTRTRMGVGKDGVVVSEVSGAEARTAGIDRGDLVLMVGGERTDSLAAFTAAVRKSSGGRPVMLLVSRGDVRRFVAVRRQAQAE